MSANVLTENKASEVEETTQDAFIYFYGFHGIVLVPQAGLN